MKVLAEKTTQKSLLTLELVSGIIIMAAAFIFVPFRVFSIDKELLTNGFVWAVVIGAMAFFGGIGFFGFIRPYFLFRKLPEVQAETDGRYLYIHSTKEAKIPLTDMEDASIEFENPYMMSKEFLIHLLSERYGKVIIKVPGYGKYRLHYIADAQTAAAQITALVEQRISR